MLAVMLACVTLPLACPPRAAAAPPPAAARRGSPAPAGAAGATRSRSRWPPPASRTRRTCSWQRCWRGRWRAPPPSSTSMRRVQGDTLEPRALAGGFLLVQCVGGPRQGPRQRGACPAVLIGVPALRSIHNFSASQLVAPTPLACSRPLGTCRQRPQAAQSIRPQEHSLRAPRAPLRFFSSLLSRWWCWTTARTRWRGRSARRRRSSRGCCSSWRRRSTSRSEREPAACAMLPAVLRPVPLAGLPPVE